MYLKYNLKEKILVFILIDYLIICEKIQIRNTIKSHL